MKNRILIIFLLVSLLMGGALSLSQTELSDGELLSAFDDARFLEGTSLSFTVEAIDEGPEEEAERAVIRLFFKEIEGEDYSRIEFLEPKELAGQIYLTTPEATYFMGPDLETPLRISEGQTLFGSAPVGQVAGIRFADEYRVKERREVEPEEGQPGLEVDLEKQEDSDVPFPEASVIADGESLLPLSITYFALSGDPLYTVQLQEYQELEGDSYLKVQLIEDLLQPGNRTTLDIIESAAEELPDELFDPDQLGQ